MTTTSQIDVDTATVTRTIRIEASRELVWAALTTPEHIARWFGQRADFPDGVHPGATGSFGWTEHGDFPVRIEAFEPFSRFAFTWGTPGEEIREDNATTATFTLTAHGDATELTVVEAGFDTLSGDLARQRAAMEGNAEGWVAELDELHAHVLELRDGTDPVSDLERGTITHSVLVDAEQASVWAALTTPEAIAVWWEHPAVFPDGVVPGSLGTFEWTGHGLFPVLIDRVEQPDRFAFTWGEVGESEPGPTATHVTFSLAPAGSGRTLLTVVETGFDNREAADRRAAIEGNVEGWRAVLASLQRHLQGRG